MKTIRRFPLAASLIGAAFAVSPVVSEVQAQAQGTWSTAAETTTQRREVGTAESGGKIYVMGGEAMGREDSPLAQEFDPASGRWRDLAPMPKGSSHVGVAALGGKIYVAGGFTANVHKNPLD